MRAGSVGRLRLTLPTALSFAGGPGAGVWEGQRYGCRNGACGVRTGARLRPLCPWGKAPDGLPGGGLRAFFRREAPGSGFVVWGCAVVPGAGAGRRTVWKGSGWRLSELGATGSGAVGGAGGSGEGGKAAR